MKEGLPQTNDTIDELKVEHLNDGIQPIMASLEGVDISPIIPDPKKVVHVDLYANDEEVFSNRLKKEGSEDYVISSVDESDKFSHSFADCTGVIAVGLETKSGNNISFLSHQSPTYFLHDKKVQFIKDLQEKLEEIKAKCKKGTIDVVMIGGRYAKVRDYGQPEDDRGLYIKEYVDSIKLVSDEIRTVLGFYPVIIGGPKLSPAHDSVMFNTKERRLHLQRGGGRQESGFLTSFSSKNLDEVSKSWKPGLWGLPE